MKSFLVTIAALVLMVNIWLVTNDLMTLNRHTNELKYIAAQASVSGAMFLNNTAYQDGSAVFDDFQVLNAIKDIVIRNMHLNDNMQPLSDSYWKNTVSVNVFIFDDLACREYKDGVFVNQYDFTFPYLFTDVDSAFSQAIATPTVCVVIDAGERPIGGGMMKFSPSVRRSGAHELVGR
jgi:hypothetical protein